MNREPENRDFLDDVLSEATPAPFREAMLDQMLRGAGRRRSGRRIRVASMLIAALALAGMFAWRHRPNPISQPPRTIAEKRYRLITTEPLPVSAIISTRSFGSDFVIASTASVEVVETESANKGFRVIDDNELLAMVGSRPAALVRLDDHFARLIFVNPEDARGFPVN